MLFVTPKHKVAYLKHSVAGLQNLLPVFQNLLPSLQDPAVYSLLHLEDLFPGNSILLDQWAKHKLCAREARIVKLCTVDSLTNKRQHVKPVSSSNIR